VKFGFENISTAQRWQASRKGRIAEGRLFPEEEKRRQQEEEARDRERLNFAAYAERWQRACDLRKLKQTTRKEYRRIVKQVLGPRFGTMRLDEINRAHVREMVEALTATGLKAKSIHNVIRVLSAIYSLAKDDELVMCNPAENPSRFVRNDRRKDEIEVFDKQEMEIILNAFRMKQPNWYALVALLFRTGMRFGEAVALKIKDIDLRKRQLLVRRSFSSGQFLEESPKNGKARKVDVSRNLLMELRDHLTLMEAEAAAEGEPAPAPENWVFKNSAGGLILTNNFRDRVWRPMLKSLGLRYRDVKSIRHTFATLAIMAGVNVVYVSKQLGHSSITLTVDTYTHWIDAAERQEHDSLGVDRLDSQEVIKQRTSEAVPSVIGE
jgi:integrase